MIQSDLIGRTVINTHFGPSYPVEEREGVVRAIAYDQQCSVQQHAFTLLIEVNGEFKTWPAYQCRPARHSYERPAPTSMPGPGEPR